MTGASRILVLAMLALAGACISPIAPDNRGLMTFAADSSSVVADGFSIVNLTATIDSQNLPVGSTVTFTTSAGTFLPSGNSVTATVDATGLAHAQMRAPTDSIVALLSASMNGTTLFDTVTFRKAFPDTLALSSNHIALVVAAAATASATLTATAFRKYGSPSPGLIVSFKAYLPGDTTKLRGLLSPAVASLGTAPPTVSFTADSSCLGTVRVRAQIAVAGNKFLRDSVDIVVR